MESKLLSCSTTVTRLPSISCHSKACLLASNSVPFQSSKNPLTQLQQCLKIKAKKQRNLGPIHASSEAQISSTTSVVAEKWILEPVGDGDTKHIGFKVPMPDAFEIASNDVTVGRVPGKADMVIPVATVSGVHARIQKKGGSLLVTDLDSTNGTFVNDMRLRPGVVATAPPGSLITFGDTHLAIFRVSKIEEAPSKPEESEDSKPEESEVKVE